MLFNVKYLEKFSRNEEVNEILQIKETKSLFYVTFGLRPLNVGVEPRYIAT